MDFFPYCCADRQEQGGLYGWVNPMPLVYDVRNREKSKNLNVMRTEVQRGHVCHCRCFLLGCAPRERSCRVHDGRVWYCVRHVVTSHCAHTTQMSKFMSG